MRWGTKNIKDFEISNWANPWIILKGSSDWLLRQWQKKHKMSNCRGTTCTAWTQNGEFVLKKQDFPCHAAVNVSN